MDLAYDLDDVEWMDEVANDLAAFLADSAIELPATPVPAAANDNDIVVFHGDEAPAMVWRPKFMTVD